MKNHQTVESRESRVECRRKAVVRIFRPRPSSFDPRLAFTLVELLTVIAIIAILAAILLPTLAAVKIEAQKKQARLQISDIVTAIQNYDSAYNQMPVSTAAQTVAVANGGMFTYGGVLQTPTGTWTPATTAFYPSNNEVIAILMNLTNYPAGGQVLANLNDQKNPQRTLFLNARMVAYTNYPGVGPDLVYRDPWKNPYIITMDLNEDNQCKDPFYSQSIVSGPNGDSKPGLNGLTDPDGTADNFRFHGNVMVWSAGPDGKIDPTKPANVGVNADNILSWQ